MSKGCKLNSTSASVSIGVASVFTVTSRNTTRLYQYRSVLLLCSQSRQGTLPVCISIVLCCFCVHSHVKEHYPSVPASFCVASVFTVTSRNTTRLYQYRSVLLLCSQSRQGTLPVCTSIVLCCFCVHSHVKEHYPSVSASFYVASVLSVTSRNTTRLYQHRSVLLLCSQSRQGTLPVCISIVLCCFCVISHVKEHYPSVSASFCVASVFTVTSRNTTRLYQHRSVLLLCSQSRQGTLPVCTSIVLCCFCVHSHVKEHYPSVPASFCVASVFTVTSRNTTRLYQHRSVLLLCSQSRQGTLPVCTSIVLCCFCVHSHVKEHYPSVPASFCVASVFTVTSRNTTRLYQHRSVLLLSLQSRQGTLPVCTSIVLCCFCVHSHVKEHYPSVPASFCVASVFTVTSRNTTRLYQHRSVLLLCSQSRQGTLPVCTSIVLCCFCVHSHVKEHYPLV